VSDTGAPPAAGITASRELSAKYRGLPMAEAKAIRAPSGDQTGDVSGPGWSTIFVTVSSARFSR